MSIAIETGQAEMLQAPGIHLDRAVVMAWNRECYRSLATSRLFDAELKLVRMKKPYKGWKTIFSYPTRAVESFSFLISRKPRVIFCHNQPAILPIICWIYAVFTRATVIMDFHSGALSDPVWRRFLPFYKMLARRAPFTICHNRIDGAVVESWGVRVAYFISVPQERFGELTYAPRSGRPLFLFSCSFNADEPVEVTFEAMRQCPDYDFVVSGNYKKYGVDPATMPANIRLAGFMDYDDYLKTMAESCALITLSDRAHIMQMAVHEAITLGTPVVTNKSPTLEEVLGDGAVYCDLTVPSLVAGLHEAVETAPAKAEAMKRAKVNAFRHLGEEVRGVRPLILQKIA